MKPTPPDAAIPLVPFVPFRCPHCGENKPKTHGVHGRIRYHRCQHCGQKFRSLEVPAVAVLGWCPSAATC